MDDISDEELRRRLTVDYKMDCPPVTGATRKVMLRKLMHLEQQAGRSFQGDNNSVQVEDLVICDESEDSTDEESDTTRELVIDESVIANGSPRYNTEQASRTPSSNRQSLRRKTHSEMDAIKTFNEIQSSTKIPKPQTSTPKLAPQNVLMVSLDNRRLNEFSSESESDDNDLLQEVNKPREALSFGSSSPQRRRTCQARIFGTAVGSGSRSGHRPILSRPPIQPSSARPQSSSLLRFSDTESDLEDSHRSEKICKMLLSHRPTAAGSFKSRASSLSKKLSDWWKSFKGAFSFSWSAGTDDSPVVTYNTTTNYISWALLIFVILFFVVIFSVYIFARVSLNSKNSIDLNDYGFIEDKSKLDWPKCEFESQSSSCLHDSDLKPALNIVKEIKAYIDKKVYLTFCEMQETDKELNLFEYPLSQVKEDILQAHGKLEGGKFDDNFENAVHLIKHNAGWNIEAKDFKFAPTSHYPLILPLSCRAKLYVRTHFLLILPTILIGFASFAVLAYFRYKQRKASEERGLVYELIDKSIELLQSPDEPQSMPVQHLRDTLLTAAERKSARFQRIWDKVVEHIETCESRVKVDYKHIEGEDYKAWKWIALNNTVGGYFLPDEPEIDGTHNEVQNISGVEWQGQACVYNSVSKNNSPARSTSTKTTLKPDANAKNGQSSDGSAQSDCDKTYSPGKHKGFKALTCFLKIRNIFEKEAQYHDHNWAQKIRNTILEKSAATSPTGDHGIVHLSIDHEAREGLVFLKCHSILAATNVFNALHGWWCEKKLVSVKFLKADRYYLRFPEARDMKASLSITNFTV